MTGSGHKRTGRLPVLGGPSDDIHGGAGEGREPGFAPATADLGELPPELVEEHLVSTRPSSSSVIDKRPALGDLLDLDSFRDICASFVDLYKIGIKIFDSDGTKLVDIRVGNGDWCGYIFSNPTGRTRCTALVTRIKQNAYPELEAGEIVEQSCFSGLKYVVMPISYAGDLLGRVVYGPFMPASLEGPGEAVYGFGDGFDPNRLWQYGDKIRRAPDEMIIKILNNFRGVIDTVTFIAMKSLMTRLLHEESMTASYNELQHTNQQLRTSLERLQELDRMKSSFLAMVSHELKTPLTSVIGYSEMLIEGVTGELNEVQLRYLSTIKTKGESLLELIGSLLDLSRIEAGAIELSPEPCTVEELVAESLSSVVPQAQKKSLRLEQNLPPGLPTLNVDPAKIRQVLINLLGNAVKFTGEGGRIEVRAETWRGPRGEADPSERFGAPDELFVRLFVTDDGIGIPPEKVERIFESFYQVDSSITRKYGGTGLGLAISKKLVEAHRGEIQVWSRVGEGTRFEIRLPV